MGLRPSPAAFRINRSYTIQLQCNPMQSNCLALTSAFDGQRSQGPLDMEVIWGTSPQAWGPLGPQGAQGAVQSFFRCQ